MLVFASNGTTYAQSDVYPAHYGLAHELNNYYNPSAFNQTSKLALHLGNQFYSGLFTKVENHYLLGSINLSGKDSSRNRNNLGVKMVNEKEGDFISKPSYYVSYSWHTSISSIYSLGAGLNIGMAGYVFKATNVSAGGSASKPDADFGLSFYSDNLNVGVSGNQLFNNLVSPKNYSFRLKRFYTLFASKKYSIGESSTFCVYFQKMILTEAVDRNNLGLNFLLAKSFLLGSNYYIDEKLTFLTGFKELNWANNSVDLVFSYNIASKNATQLNSTSFELLLSYKIIK